MTEIGFREIMLSFIDCMKRNAVSLFGKIVNFSDDAVRLCLTYKIHEFIGYLKSWSAYQRFQQENPHDADPLLDTEAQ
jgi:hypothetical protein